MEETKLFSRSEVSKHNDNKSSWIIIHNSVYDVTQFLGEHPGGEEVLLEQAGKEGSEPFEDVGHSSDARSLMKKYKIGELVESERKETKETKMDWTEDGSSSSSRVNSKSKFNKPLPGPADELPDSGAESTQPDGVFLYWSSLGSWVIPLILGIIATIVYKFLFA